LVSLYLDRSAGGTLKPAGPAKPRQSRTIRHEIRIDAQPCCPPLADCPAFRDRRHTWATSATVSPENEAKSAADVNRNGVQVSL
jgi:hypothetical protein